MLSNFRPPPHPADAIFSALSEQFDKALAGRVVSHCTRRRIISAAYQRAIIGACVSFRVAGPVIVLDGCRQTSSLQEAAS